GPQDKDTAAPSRAADREGRELAVSGVRAGAPLLRRLVIVDRRSRLGDPAAARIRIFSAESLQHRVLQERQGRRRYKGRTGDDRQDGKNEVLPRRPGADLEGRAVGAAGRRKAPVGA